MLLLLPLLLGACASVPTNWPPSVPVVPPLPMEARQPALPGWCSPNCSAGWRKLVETLLKGSTPPAQPVQPVKPLTSL